jgi:hypothetical protein
MNQPDVQEAREAFERAESESDPTEKLDALEEALALVEEILEEEGLPEPQKAFARNVRKTYLRRLLQQLMGATHVQFSDWFGYMRLLLVDQREVVQEIVDADEALRDSFQSFIALWSRQFKDALGQDIDEFIKG